VRTDERTGKTNYLERKVDDLLMRSTNDGVNPYLMPDDAVVCYDSMVTSFRDVIRSVSDVLIPATLILNPWQ
jgi:polysaccharide export outer membrane protein